MGSVEIRVDEGEDTKVVLHNNLRFLLRRVRVKNLQRHLVATWPNCSCGKRRLDDASFILVLKTLFLICIFWYPTVALCGFYLTNAISPYPPNIRDQIWRVWIFDFKQPMIVFLTVFTAMFVISVLVRMKSRPSSQEKRVGVKTISGDIQNL